MRALLMAPPVSKSLIQRRLARVDAVEVVTVDGDGPAADYLPTADILLVAGSQFGPNAHAELMRPGSRVKWIQLLNAGYDRIPVAEIPATVLISNAGAGLSAAVADQAMALLLALARQLVPALEGQRAAHWASENKGPMLSLYNKTAVIVGFGPIGQDIARRLKAFGARTIAVTRHGLPHEAADQCYPLAQLDEALSQADAIVCAMPLNDESLNLFDAARFGRCKRGVLFVNIARGRCADTAALQAALESGQLGGAGLDVTEPEPLPDGHPLWGAPNLIITPHKGGGGGFERLADFVGENVERFVAGQQPMSLIPR